MRSLLCSLLILIPLGLPAEEDVVLKKTSVSQYDESGAEKVRISPQEARISGDRTTLKGVEIRTFSQGKEELRIVTPSCLIDKSYQDKKSPLHKGASQETVEISGPGFTITGLGFDFEFRRVAGPDGKNRDSRTFFIRDRVKSSWRAKEADAKAKADPLKTPAHKSDKLPAEKLDITAQNLIYDDTGKQAIFEHDVIIVSEDMILTCERLTCFLEEDKDGRKQISTAIAHGNIVIKRGLQTCKCSDATYSLVENTLKLTGKPVITEGRDTLQARRITILLAPKTKAGEAADPKAPGDIVLFDEPVITAWRKLDLEKPKKTPAAPSQP
ncbi:MAG: hypothetical protein RL095_3943 [Verrucomicrobiota bacterium]|jgi:lipopolysaccharide transport protein LptA